MQSKFKKILQIIVIIYYIKYIKHIKVLCESLTHASIDLSQTKEGLKVARVPYKDIVVCSLPHSIKANALYWVQTLKQDTEHTEKENGNFTIIITMQSSTDNKHCNVVPRRSIRRSGEAIKFVVLNVATVGYNVYDYVHCMLLQQLPFRSCKQTSKLPAKLAKLASKTIYLNVELAN